MFCCTLSNYLDVGASLPLRSEDDLGIIFIIANFQEVLQG